MTKPLKAELKEALKILHLPEFQAQHSAQSALATTEGWTYDQYLLRLCELELQQRELRKRRKLLTASRLPKEKTLESRSSAVASSAMSNGSLQPCWMESFSSVRRTCWFSGHQVAGRPICLRPLVTNWFIRDTASISRPAFCLFSDCFRLNRICCWKRSGGGSTSSMH